MTIIKIILVTLLTSNAYAFTLNSNTGKGFNKNSIDIYVADTDCSGAGFTTDKYVTLIKSAMKRFWNAVPTSALYLDVKGIDTSIDIDGDNHTAAIAKTKSNTILAGCNDDATDFDQPGILGSAKMQCTGSTCKAVLILNAHANSSLKNKSEGDVEAIIAHEVGHAFGLGHSEYQYNLMYYNISGKFQKWLGQDDIDGITYLYPHDSELDVLGISLLGSCATINTKPESKTTKSFLKTFLGGIFSVMFLFMTLRLFRLRNRF